MALKNKFNPLLDVGIQKILDLSQPVNYEDNCSLLYTLRSLVDKEYVDNAIASNTPDTIYTADGTLTGDRVLLGDGNTYGITFSELTEFNIADSDSINIEALNDANFIAPIFNIGSTSSITLTMNTTDAYITDYRTIKTGLEYNADYSANYTNRSLVDKEYVDNTIFNSQPTLQDVVNKSMSVDGYVYADFGAGEIDDDLGAIQFMAHPGKDASYGAHDFVTLSFNAASGNVFIYDYRDTGNRKGLEYYEDYSDDFTSRSLVDKEYVDTHIKKNVTTKTSNYTVTINDDLIRIDGYSNTVDIQLPDITNENAGKIYIFKTKDVTNTCRVLTDSSDTFDNGNTSYVFSIVGETLEIVADLSTNEWVIIN